MSVYSPKATTSPKHTVNKTDYNAIVPPMGLYLPQHDNKYPTVWCWCDVVVAVTPPPPPNTHHNIGALLLLSFIYIFTYILDLSVTKK